MDRTWQVIILAGSGAVLITQRDDITFVYPEGIPVDHVARCGQLELPEGQSQLNARVDALKTLRNLEKRLEDASNTINQRTGEIYEAFKSSVPDAWGMTDTRTVARMIFGKVDPLTVFAVHRHLIQRSERFLLHSAARTGIFWIRPENQVMELEVVQDWARNQTDKLKTFAEKAKEVMKKSQERNYDASDRTPEQKPATHTWTADERAILKFLLLSLRPSRSNQRDPYSLGQSKILRYLYPEIPQVTDHGVHQTLIDLGVLAPWQDLASLRHDLVVNEDTDASTLKSASAVAISRPAVQPLGTQGLHTVDPLESVRHDFGAMPVYVIDDATAQELDDGVSIEPVPGEPGNVWVHVHIADPASVIPLNHEYAKLAARQGETVYFINNTWPLFPKSLMHSRTHGMSLGERESGQGDRVLSFSAKLDKTGEILEHKVRAGLIRNVQRLTYDQVDLQLYGSLIRKEYPFGGRPAPLALEKYPEQRLADLRVLDNVSQQLVQKRFRDGVFLTTEMKATIEGFKAPSQVITSPTLEPSEFSGFPPFLYAVTGMEDLDSGARRIVAEMMKIACRIASRFCTEKGLPALRRTSGRVTTRSESDMQSILDMRTPHGYVSSHKLMPYALVNPAAGYSLLPKEHYSLNVPEGEGYVRVTSPLRRYADLVTHWQIHHALLQSPGPAPFGEKELESFSMQLALDDRQRRRGYGQHERFWHLMYIKRWMDKQQQGLLDAEAGKALDDLVGVTILTPKLNDRDKTWQTEVQIPKLGVRGMVAQLPSADVPLGTEIPVKVSSVRLGTMPLLQMVRS